MERLCRNHICQTPSHSIQTRAMAGTDRLLLQPCSQLPERPLRTEAHSHQSLGSPAAATFQRPTTKHEAESNAPFPLTPDSCFLLGSPGPGTAGFACGVMFWRLLRLQGSTDLISHALHAGYLWCPRSHWSNRQCSYLF